MESELLMTTVGHVVSSLIIFSFDVMVFLQHPRRRFNQMFFISGITVAMFGTMMALGINLEPSPFAYKVWLFNIVDVFIAVTYLHLVYLFVGVAHERRWVLRIMYATSTLFVLAVIAFPSAFLPEIAPKLFTKSYLVAGPLYYAMVAYFLFGLFLIFSTLIKALFTQPEKRKQTEYLLVATLMGFGIALNDFLLAFDFPVSPLYGSFFGLYMLPLAYGILSNELADIRIVVKRALAYSFIIAVIAATLTTVFLLNDLFVSTFPSLELWVIPAIVSLVAFLFGRLVWLRTIENEHIKYEFMSVAAHKLRTPLTHINLGLGTLADKPEMTADSKELIQKLQHSNNQLIELTNILFEDLTQRAGENPYLKEKLNLFEITTDVVDALKTQVAAKHIDLDIRVDNDFVVMANRRRIRSVIQVLVENAVVYTPSGGSIQIVLYSDTQDAWFSIHDSGIGVSSKDQRYIFSRFYRTDKARQMNTDGIGLGLTMARNFVEKHGGRLLVQSRGEGTGSTFRFSLPLKGVKVL